MHICFLCNEYPPAPRVGGIGVFTRTLAGALVRRGHEVSVLGLYPQQLERIDERDGEVRVLRMSNRGRWSRSGWLVNRRNLHRAVSALHHAHPIDVIEAPDYEGLFWLAPDWGIPRVVRLHGSETYFRTHLGEPLKLHTRLAEGRSIASAHAVAGVSSYVLEATRALFRDLPRRTAVIPNPVDCTEFTPPDRREEVPGRMVYTGTLIRKKGVLDLFATLPRVFEGVPDAHLLCVGGDAADATTGSSSMVELALDILPRRFHHRVEFRGRVQHAEVRTCLRTARVCVYPSHLEAHPLAWLEAMASGKAIVASSRSVGPEIIRDGTTGLLCDPADHTRMADLAIGLLEDETKCHALGDAARSEALKRFDIETIVPMNVAFYEHLLSSR